MKLPDFIPVEIDHPAALLLGAVAAAYTLWPVRRSLAGFPPVQRRITLLARILFLLMLACALAGIHVRLPARRLAVLYALDQSASVSPEALADARRFIGESAAARGATDQIGLIGFAGDASLRDAPSLSPKLDAPWEPPAKPAQTDIAGALRFCGALFPEGHSRRLVLLTDGNATTPGATEAAATLAASGTEIFTVPLRNPSKPEVLVEKADVPHRLKNGEPFDLTATLRSNHPGPAKVKLYQNQFLLETRTVELTPGSQQVLFRNLRPEGSFIEYEVEVLCEEDTLPENNRARAIASLRGKPQVLLVDGEEARIRPLAEALRREQIDVQTRGPMGAPKSLEELQAFDLLMLSDVSALALNRDQMELYRRWVQQFGGGFLMLGGESSYGVGGYFRTPVEQMLPVRMEHDHRQDLPSVALLIVLDRSGSMSAMVQGQTKMALANQGAALALNVLQPRDYFGVLAVDIRCHTVAPLQQHSSKAPVEQKILSVTAGGGGIYIYTSLAEAFQLLRDVPARIKHVILFSDAADAEEKAAGEMGDGARGAGTAVDLAAAMNAARITTSVVALGSETDKDTPFLRELADRGNGRFYLTSDATSLPQIFTTETMKVAQSSLIEEPFLAVPSASTPLLSGIDWSQAPLLLGYNSTKPKPTADILLATERGEPLLAVWRYGLGQAAAFTSDAKARWASEWMNWPGYTQFWSQVVRGVMRKTDQAAFAVDATEDADQLRIRIDALTPEGAFRNQLPIALSALSPTRQSLTLQAQQDAPGAYTATVPLEPEGTTLFHLTSKNLPDGGYDFGHTRSYPREFLALEPNEPLLRDIAQAGLGKFNPSPAAVFEAPRQALPHLRDLSASLLIAALCLFPIDLWLRRRTWR